MPNAAPDRRGWLGPALALVGLVTGLRLVALWFDRTDLFVDESQYWFWGQHLAFGYYSKPPLIGWVIRAVTELAGSSSPFWVRFPAPVFHGATALILGAIAARYHGRKAAVWVALGYVTLPLAVVGSLLISTDTIMFPFLAAALYLWLRLAERPGRGAVPMALAAGVALGLGFMAKYAAIYFILSAALAALFVPRLRPGWRTAALAALGFAAVIWPNILWNALSGFPTLHHTADNIGWVNAPEADAGLNWGKLGSFVGAQFGVMGPLAFALLIWRALRIGRLSDQGRVLMAFVLPILALVMVEALLDRAYANWAATAYLAGAVLVFSEGGRRARGAAIAINLAICIALPLMAIWPQAVRLHDGRYAMHRYLGRTAMSEWVIAEARKQGLTQVVAGGRGVLADLFYTGRDTGLTFYAIPPRGRAKDQYQMTDALPADAQGEVLFIASDKNAVCARGRAPVASYAPATGAYQKYTFHAYRVPADCWAKRGD